MFSQPTVFVIGAGASCEFNMPSGEQLKQRVQSRLDFYPDRDGKPLGDEGLYQIINTNFDGDVLLQYRDAARELSRLIREVPFDSIDEVLHWLSSTPEAVALGKATIMREILEAERSTKLYNAKGPMAVAAATDDSTWLTYFLSMAIDSREDIARAFCEVTLINFNYDRLIEQFLYSELYNKLKIHEPEAIVDRLKIIRPYGSVGALPWQKGSPGQLKLSFGADVGDKLFSFSPDSILTYTEQKVSTDVTQQIEEALGNARLIVFLGFGFHQQNLNILKTDRYPGSKHALATVLKIDPANYDNLRGVLREELKCTSTPQLLDRKAADLMASMKLTILNPATRTSWST